MIALHRNSMELLGHWLMVIVTFSYFFSFSYSWSSFFPVDLYWHSWLSHSSNAVHLALFTTHKGASAKCKSH